MVPSILRRWIPLLVLLITLITIILVPVTVVGHGYMPVDDALRHVAKAYSGKSWSDVLVLADWVKMDHNPGWHAILGLVHGVSGGQPDDLVVFSIVFLFCVFSLAPLIWISRPEVWLGVLAIVGVAITDTLYRLHYGRPLVLGSAVVMCLLFLWNPPLTEARPWKRFALSVALIAAATWIHGGWYLFVLLPIALGLCRQWRAAGWVAAAWLGGTILGAMLSGQPWEFLKQSVEIVVRCFGEGVDQKYQVVEFQASEGSPLVCMIIAIVVVWRVLSGAGLKVINNPVFIFMVICWILGLRVMRFWMDLGTPALLVWFALQFEEPWKVAVREDSLERLGLTMALAATVFFSMSSDARARWSAAARSDLVSASDPQTTGWFPESGGIFYLTRMGQFYRLFFENPNGNWRYSTGFEPTFMPEDDLATYRRISRQPRDPEVYQPWLKKMRPIDRIMVEQADPVTIPGLEWHLVGQRTWIGRLPQPKKPAGP